MTVDPMFRSPSVRSWNVNVQRLSIIKNIRRDKRVGLQLRMDVFDILNHANFGPPGNVAGGPTFGKMTRTRFPTGEAGSPRQNQLAVKAWF